MVDPINVQSNRGEDTLRAKATFGKTAIPHPPVNFAFTFGGVSADNPDAGPGDPPTATETDFNYTGNDFGGLRFGTASAGDLAFSTTAIFEMDITANNSNALTSLVL